MENILSNIKRYGLIKHGQVVAVATSGGSDSMALLHFLFTHKEELDIDVCAVHVNHSLREKSAEDADFVLSYCRRMGIRAYKFKVDVQKLATQKNLGIEEAAREARYGIFESLLKRDVADVIALAHHQADQAETILLNLFRGTGTFGARGMDYKRDVYIRPMLDTSKKAIMDYIFACDVPYITDETNADNSFSRNYIRNQIMPLVESRWPGATTRLVQFGKTCAEDNAYIQSQIFEDAVIYEERLARIPLSYFLYPKPVVSRLIFTVLKNIGVTHDIERKHISMIVGLVNAENGKKLRLPLRVTAFKEYDYITITNTYKEKIDFSHEFEIGTFDVPNFGSVTVRKSKILTLKPGELIMNPDAIPADAVWRFRGYGDMFEKFGGGTKKLKDYLIDKKIPARVRDFIPVLASGRNILAIAGLEISNSVRVEDGQIPVIKIIAPPVICG